MAAIFAQLPPALQAALESELDTSETLRWAGQPSAPREFRRALPIAIVGFVFCAGVSTVLALGARAVWQELHGLEPVIEWTRPGERPGYGSVWMCAAFSALMALAALLATFVPSFAARTARRTVHAVTTTRILSLEVQSDRSVVKSLEPGHPLHLKRTDLGDGEGDIVLYPASSGRTGAATLWGITGAREVDRLIRATFDSPTRS